MKSNEPYYGLTSFALPIFLCSILLTIVGCNEQQNAEASSDKFLPIENGFGYGGHSHGFTDRKMWAGLQYRDANGQMTVVWPYLGTASPVVQITNNVAVFVGGITALDQDGVERLTQRLIGFEAPAGPPVDITDQVLMKWCAESGVALTNISKDPFVSLTKSNEVLQISFVILKRNVRGPGDIMGAGATAIVSWSDIEAIIQDVKKNGKVEHEKRSDFEYLQKN
jgi:hypothetical protein